MAKRKVFGISRDLNEGISQTINAAKNNAGQLRYEVIPLTKIKFDPENPRKLAIQPTELLDESTLASVDPLFERKLKELESLRSLSNSIKRSGVRNAIEVYKDGIHYRLVSGERRVLASLIAGKDDIQARIIDNKPSEFDIRYLQWIENIEREDLSIWERIQNVRQLTTTYSIAHKVEVTASILKDILGCSLPHAMTYLAILQAPSDIQALIQQQTLTNLEKVAFLAKIENAQIRTKLAQACSKDNISLSTLKKLLQAETTASKTLPLLPKKSKGRTAKRITLGYTAKLPVAKQLIELVVSQPQFQSLAANLKIVDWEDCTSVSKAFQAVIKFMEKQSLTR